MVVYNLIFSDGLQKAPNTIKKSRIIVFLTDFFRMRQSFSINVSNLILVRRWLISAYRKTDEALEATKVALAASVAPVTAKF